MADGYLVRRIETDTILVVGAGPSGMMAAGRAAEAGARVVLVEKNRRPGRKLLVTGGGRCNVTTAITDRHLLVSRYGPRAAGLHSPFSRFTPADMREFLRSHGLETKVENESRVFPITDSAASVRALLESYLAEGGVDLRTGTTVTEIRAEGRRVTEVVLASGQLLEADAVILATGGTSRPETGSTGDGLHWLESLGHEVRLPEPSLVPVAVREEWPSRLQGLGLAEVKLIVALDGKRQLDATGKLLFTHFGLSGPLVLNLSQQINELAQGGPVELRLDLFPTTDGGELTRSLQGLFDESGSKKLRNAIGRLVAPRLAGVVLERSGVDGETRCHSVGKDSRRLLAQTLKGLSMTFASLLGADRAVVSSGGVSPDEIDFRTMASKRYDNLYVTGDMIDVDRQSSGFSLQLCWSTGWVAGESAATALPPGREAERSST